MVIQKKSQNRNPEKIVLVIGILFLILGAMGMQLIPHDWWVFPAMFVIWGVGAVVNAIIRFIRPNDNTRPTSRAQRSGSRGK